MLRYILKRLLIIIPTLLGVLLIIFTINKMIPGDPAKLALGSNFTQEAYEAKREEMGLDKSFVEQYVDNIGYKLAKFSTLLNSLSSNETIKKVFSKQAW